jgi:hypothetical protein
MSSDKKPPELSPSGNPIYRYEAPTPFAAAGGDANVSLISDHIAAHLGKAANVFHEIASDTVHIDVHIVMPNDACPCLRLVTSGMSDLPMHLPEGVDAPRYLELMMTLPPDWHLSQEAFKDERWYWPVRLLKTLARFPHKYKTWLGWAHTVSHGNPPTPYAANTGLCGAIVLPSVSVPKQFLRLRVNAEKEIVFFAIVPLYEEEMNLKLRFGSDKLIKKLDAARISDLVDIARENVATRKKWFGFI